MLREKLDLKGKVALVTGGGTGLGRAMALALAQVGADIALAARRPQPLEEAATEIRSLGRKALVVLADITDSAQVQGMVAAVIQELGRVDILINNAGIVTGWQPKPIWDITDQEWQLGLDTNLSGAFYCSRAVSRHMAERRSGVIINVSSGFGIRAMRDNYPYCCAKAGVILLTKTLALSLNHYNIRVNCIAPGFHATIPQAQEHSYGGRFIPLGRIGDPREIAGLALFLASDASSYITGEVFIADGGGLAGGYAPTNFTPATAQKKNQ